MNKLQQQSLTSKDTPYITDLIEEGFEKTQAMIAESLARKGHIDTKVPQLSFGGMTLSRDYYNLFVIGGEKFDTGNFSISKDRALVASIEPDVKQRFFNLHNDSVIEQILTLPSLFMSENVDFMRSRPGQKVLFGRVTEIMLTTNTVKIAFEAEKKLFQQSITDISHRLGISGDPGCSELNNTHWTIKQIDLIKILIDAGILTIPSS